MTTTTAATTTTTKPNLFKDLTVRLSTHNISQDGFAEVSVVQGDNIDAQKRLGEHQTASSKSKLVPPSKWTQVLRLNYQLGSIVYVNIRLYRMENRGIKIIGAALFEVGRMVENQSWISMKKLPLGGAIVAEVAVDKTTPKEVPSVARFRLQTMQLTNPECSLSDTQLKVSKLDKGFWVKVDRFDESLLEIDTKWNWPLHIALYDTRQKILLGSNTTNLHDLLFKNNDKSKKGQQILLKKGDKVSGAIQLNRIEETSRPVKSPTSISLASNVCIAIDFTATNGDILSQKSLHTIKRSPNTFHISLSKVAKLFVPKQRYTTWGFGAKIQGKVRPVFQCGSKPSVTGSKGLQIAYTSFLGTQPKLSGPKNLEAVIQAAATKGRILVILSDLNGVDMDKMKKFCTMYPQLRVVLVGLGTSPLLKRLDRSTIGKNLVFLSIASI